MARYEVEELPDGIWIVIDYDTGDEIYESLDEWKARDWCDFMNQQDALVSDKDWDEFN